MNQETPLRAVLPTLALLALFASPSSRAAGSISAEAQPFAEGLISTPDSFGASFSPDGETFYFARRVPAKRISAIMISRRRDGRWTEPETAPWSGEHGEGDAQLSPDGSRLFFWSRRSAPGKPSGPRPIPDLWFVDVRGGTYSEPRSVGASGTATWTPLSLGYGGPSPAADGTLYAFRGPRSPSEKPRLVCSRLAGESYEVFEDLGDSINGTDGGFDPFVAPDQSYLLFSSDRPDSYGGADLYVSHRGSDGRWSAPRNLGPAVNSAAAEYEVALSPDGGLLVFTRAQRGIFAVATQAVGLGLAPQAPGLPAPVAAPADSDRIRPPDLP